MEWVSKGFADNIMDSLIASGKAKEMILIMPDRALWTAKEKKQLLSASGKDLEVLWEALNERSHRYVIDEVMPFCCIQIPTVRRDSCCGTVRRRR